jgi:hypothetical protein
MRAYETTYSNKKVRTFAQDLKTKIRLQRDHEIEKDCIYLAPFVSANRVMKVRHIRYLHSCVTENVFSVSILEDSFF